MAFERKLVIPIIGDARSFEKAIAKSIKASDNFSSRLGRIVKSGALAGIAAIGAGTAIAIGFGVKAVRAAVSLQESMFAVHRTFHRGAKIITEFSETTANALGITRDDTLEFANSLGGVMTGLGISGKHAANMSKRLITLASDVAIFNKADPADVVMSFQRALAGGARGLKKYGIVIDNAAIKNEAVRSGIADMVVSSGDVQKAQVKVTQAIQAQAEAIKKYGSNSDQARDATANLTYNQEKLTKAIGGKMPSLTPQQKMLATINLLWQKTIAVQGTSRKRMGTWGQVWKRIHAAVHDLTEEFGTGLLPVVNRVARALANRMADPRFRKWVHQLSMEISQKLLAAFNRLSAWFQKNWPEIRRDLQITLRILLKMVHAAERLAHFIGKFGFLQHGPGGTGKVTTPEGVANLPPGLRRKVMAQMGVTVNGEVHVNANNPQQLGEAIVRHGKKKSSQTRGRQQVSIWGR